MGRHAVMVMGPAGSGKTTLSQTLLGHMEAKRCRAKLLNLDPAAEMFEYEPYADIKDLVSVIQVMETQGVGPNGALVICFEHLLDNLHWLEDAMGQAPEDDYWIIDCPGQIELYTHYPVMRQIVDHMRYSLDIAVCGVYCIESTFTVDPSKYFSACLCAMSAMMQFEIPHVNVFTKMDLLKDQLTETQLERYLWPDTHLLEEWAEKNGCLMFNSLNKAIGQLLDSYDMVAFTPLDITDEDSIAELIYKIDLAVQYGEDLEPRQVDQDCD